MHTTKAGSRLIHLITSGTLVLLLVSSLISCQRPQPSSQRFLQFGTLIDITLIADNEIQAATLFENIEKLLTTRHTEWHGWLDGTLKRFNQSLSQQPVLGTLIPATLKQLVTDSKKYYTTSSGLFNPAMGKLIAAWGFHEYSEADHELISTIKKNIPGMNDLVIKNDRAFSLNTHLQLDFGAIAKGLAIKQIAEIITREKVQDFIINAGGDVYTHGQKYSRAWRIAIENPFAPGILGSLNMESESSIFTSGNYRRFYTDKNQRRRHHIIHPLSGEPSINISAATVIHQDPVIADVAATTLMLTDISRLGEMATRFGIRDYLVITEQRQVYASKSMLARIDWHKADNLTINVQ